MSFQFGYSMETVKTVFAEEIVAAGGTVSDSYSNENCLLTRSILPWIADVRSGDMIQGGVALKAREYDVWVYPYVFRHVCTNGAIIAQALQTEHLEQLDFLPVDQASERIREAVQSRSERAVFQVSVRQMRLAQEREVDLMLTLMPLLSRLQPRFQDDIVQQILDRFLGDRDSSQYGLMNAVTSVGRDTPDPDVRWRLEELGGRIPAMTNPSFSPDITEETFALHQTESLIFERN